MTAMNSDEPRAGYLMGVEIRFRRTAHGSVLHLNARYSPATRANIDADDDVAYLDGIAMQTPVLCPQPGPFDVVDVESTLPWCETCSRELMTAVDEVRIMEWFSQPEGARLSREATVLEDLEDDS